MTHPSDFSSNVCSNGILMKFHSDPALPDPCPDPYTGELVVCLYELFDTPLVVCGKYLISFLVFVISSHIFLVFQIFDYIYW